MIVVRFHISRQTVDFLCADASTLEAKRLYTGLEDHISAADRILSFRSAKDCPRVCFGHGSDCDSGREACLDEVCDDILERPLGGHDDMDSDGPPLLRQPDECITNELFSCCSPRQSGQVRLLAVRAPV